MLQMATDDTMLWMPTKGTMGSLEKAKSDTQVQREAMSSCLMRGWAERRTDICIQTDALMFVMRAGPARR